MPSGIVLGSGDSKVPFSKNFHSHQKRQEFREHSVSLLCPGPFTRTVLGDGSSSSQGCKVSGINSTL